MIQKILDFFEKKGILKMFLAFAFLAIIIVIYRKWPSDILTYIALIPIAYIVIAILLGLGFGICGAIKDYKEWKKSKGG